MVWSLAVILFVLWDLEIVSGYAVSVIVHLLLALMLALALVQLIQNRKSTSPLPDPLIPPRNLP